MSRIVSKLELELDGQNNGWTDVTNDLVGSQKVRYGLGGTGIKDRIASTGSLAFALDNSAKNSAQLQGYYAPNHANRRSGFANGIRARFSRSIGESYAAQILTDGPVGYWRLGEPSGTVCADSSGNGHTAVYNNTPTLGVTGPLADGSTAVTGNGDESASVAALGGPDLNHVLTIEFWFKGTDNATQFSSSGPQRTNGTVGWGFNKRTVSPNGTLGIRIDTSAATNQVKTFPGVLWDGTWYHIAVTLDNGFYQMFKNGVRVASGTYSHGTGFANAAATLYPFRTAGSNAASFEEVALYDYVLTTEQLAAHYALATATGITTYYKHVGTLDEITPIAGRFESQLTNCVSVDYMDDLARTNVSGLDIQVDKRSDELFEMVLATMTRQPSATEIEEGFETFPLALDDVKDEKTKVLSVLFDIVMSELGLAYVKGDTDQGGTLVFENRGHRPTQTGVVDTYLDTTFVTVGTQRRRSDALNALQISLRPRRPGDSDETIIYQLKSVMEIAPGESRTLLGPYIDITNGNRVGARDFVDPPESGTDYLANAQADGLGADLTASLNVDAAFGGNGVRWTLTNLGFQTLYVGGSTAGTKLQGRGRPIYAYDITVVESEDATSITQNGKNLDTLDLKYLADVRVAGEAVIYLVNLYKDPLTQVQGIRFFCPNTDVVLGERLLAREISHRVAIQETVTGLSTSLAFFINSVEIDVDQHDHMFVTFTLCPADTQQYWLLEVVSRSELDQSTVLGFGLIVGHTDIAHGDSHVDSAHADTPHQDEAHEDEHADEEHADSEHTDVAHTDVAHSDSHTDTAHTDTAHSDRAHTDSHSDVSHTDVAHSDVAHSDTAHSDVTHGDQSHVDTPHADLHVDAHGDEGGEHGDEHFDAEHDDVSHSDVSHSDTPHSDTAHSDSHSDVAHSDSHGDISHLDTAHSDVGHGDVAHGDSVHNDVAFVDVGHADEAHDDTPHDDEAHVDVNHVDEAHVDEHTDQVHADLN